MALTSQPIVVASHAPRLSQTARLTSPKGSISYAKQPIARQVDVSAEVEDGPDLSQPARSTF